MSRRAYRILPTDDTTFHPRLLGTHGAVAANSYLSVNAGIDVLKAGGNAIDAAVAATFVEGLVNPQMHTIGGECPILVRPAGERRVHAVNGNMMAPGRATPEAYRARGLSDVPDSGILAAGVPAAFGALLTALTRWGTMPLREVIAPAIELAREGFPVSEGLRKQHKYGIEAMQERFRRDWPGSAALYLPGGRMPEMKLAYADREQYYGDPSKTWVPAEVLLSAEYARRRAALIDMRRANRELRPGDARRNAALLPGEERFTPKDWGAGTVHVDAVDAKGNLASFTPSGGWISSADVIAPLGFPLSVRMMTFYLAPAHHPNVIAPFKRPRTTLTPSMAFRDGKPWMAFGTMGSDNQGQWLLQYYLCAAAFGMSIPQAIEAPRLSSEHTPGFFAPHASEPNRVRIEPRFGAKVLEELRRRGHDLDVAPDWTEGFVSAATFDQDTGLVEAGCDPRGAKAECFPSFAYCW